MQKRCEPCALASRRRGEHRVDVHQLLGLEARVGVRRLRAIAAILRAAAGLDRQQGAQLHLARRVMRAMHLRRAEHELGERKVEERRDLGAGPVGAGHCLRYRQIFVSRCSITVSRVA